jgi:hypothetical protein
MFIRSLCPHALPCFLAYFVTSHSVVQIHHTHIKRALINTVACVDVAMQRPEDRANEQRPFLGNGSVDTFPLQGIRSKQKKSVFCVVRAQML